MHVAVGLGVAVATAVLTGALLVGDSVRGSLRDLTLQRLGRIDSALVTGHFFRTALAEEVHGEPAILMPGTLEAGSGDDARRATQVSIVGVRDEFWKFADHNKTAADRSSRSRRETWRSPSRLPASWALRPARRFSCGFQPPRRFLPIVRSAKRTTRRAADGCAWPKCCRPTDSRDLPCSPRSSCRGTPLSHSPPSKTCSNSRSGRTRSWSAGEVTRSGFQPATRRLWVAHRRTSSHPPET